MKDTVKITVIATGFKDSDRRHRQAQSPIGYSVSRDFEDDFRTPQPEPDVESEPAPPAMIMESASPTPGLAVAQSGTVEAMRNAMIANFEQADLDVPAFLRKRTEPM